MTDNSIVALFKCLADKSRLQILQSLAMEDMYVERLSERLNLTPPTISFHLKKLAEAGLVRSYRTQYYAMYALNREMLGWRVLDLIEQPPEEADAQEAREEAYRQKVLKAFFEYGKLRSIPAQKKKERIVLEEIVKAFEPGRTYTEREVNTALADYFDDFCTLRRDMIGEGLLARDNGVYWRL